MQLPGVAIPHAPVPERELLAQLQALLKGSMNAAHPGFIGHMDSMPTTISFLGELATATINNNMLSLEMSPLFALGISAAGGIRDPVQVRRPGGRDYAERRQSWPICKR